MVDADGLTSARTDALLWLSPSRVRSVSAVPSIALDEQAMIRWGLQSTTGVADLVVVSEAERAGTVPAETVAGWSSPPRNVPAGHRVAAYRGRQAAGGALVLTPLSRASMGRPAMRRAGGRTVWVSAAGTTTPAIVRAAVPGATVTELVVSSDPRRRVAFMLRRPDDHATTLIVKAGVGRHGADRNAPEQAMLRQLHDLGVGAHVPEPHGDGELDGLHWAAETVVFGTPMIRMRPLWWRVHGAMATGAVIHWLEDLAVRSARPAPPRWEDRGLHPVGEAAAWMRAALDSVACSPGVVTHGDLVTGDNILVAGRRFSVIDWETGTRDGVPLVDLLPMCCWSLARCRGLGRPSEQADFVVDLCAGSVAESPMLLDLVSRYLGRVGLPLRAAGPLAAVAWAHAGSMRARNAGMVQAAGDQPRTWTSMAELVLERWMVHPRLGHGWAACTGEPGVA